MRTPLKSAATATLLAMWAAACSGCEALQNALSNVESRTVTFEPVRTGARHAVDYSNFGICHSRLESRVVGSRLWHLFTDRLGPTVSGISGHEVRIARGESCHLREVHRFQSAVLFDLSSVPAGPVTLVELRMRGLADYGTDPPIRVAPRGLCARHVVGRATVEWPAGITGIEGWFHLISSAPLSPPTFQLSSGRPFGPFIVTDTVNAWRNGTFANLGFTIEPDAGEVARYAGRIGELNEQYMCGVMMGEYRLVVTVLVRRT